MKNTSTEVTHSEAFPLNDIVKCTIKIDIMQNQTRFKISWPGEGEKECPCSVHEIFGAIEIGRLMFLEQRKRVIEESMKECDATQEEPDRSVANPMPKEQNPD
jgi:hypothetical protein